MIRQSFLAIALAVAASPALALSCMAPDVTQAYQSALTSEDRYIVATGTLNFDARKLPKAIGNDSPPSTRIPATFTGQALSKTGFDVAFDRKITLEVLCFGPWCGGAGAGETYLTFLKQGERGYVMSADPCGSLNFYQPTDEMLSTVAQCYKDGRCAD